jgi:hypothetical protein
MTSTDDETLPNFIKRNHPRKGEKKKQGGKDQSPGKQTAQKRRATRRQRKPLSTETKHTPSKVLLCAK